MWDENETLINERFYQNDKLNGPFSDWYANGNKKSEGTFLNDAIQGILKEYNIDGTLNKEELFENGIKKRNNDNN